MNTDYNKWEKFASEIDDEPDQDPDGGVDAGMGGTGSGGSVQLTAGGTGDEATAGSAGGKVGLWELTLTAH